MNWPLVSVIIPTYVREEPLCDTLADILKQDYPQFEVLVIDQTAEHQPPTQTYLETLAAQEKIQWFRIDWASLPGARNYGVRRAKGEIIVFIDDDVRLDENFLKNHARNYLDHPEVGAVAGRVFDRMILEHSQPGFEIDYLPPQAMDPGIAWYYLDLVHTVKPQQVLSGRGCNMSFRREIFTEHGLRFDERYRGSAVREESDFCLGVRQTGYKIWYDPEAGLVHLGEPTGGCHDISTRSLQYQITHYHNHFWMAFKHLTPWQTLRLSLRLFDCHVLGRPPCHKTASLSKTLVRGVFYFWGLGSALGTWLQSLWTDQQIYSQQDPEYAKS